jgi:hypothetical protein
MIKKWAAKAASRITEQIASLLMRSAIRPLLNIDERSLFDIGLSGSDVIACLSAPITTNPARYLDACAKRRGRAHDIARQ